MESSDIITVEPKIIECNIEPYPRPMPEGMFDPMPAVKVRFDNGEEKIIFQFFPDELTFDSKDFLGLTEKLALDLKFEKDKQYIQS